MGSWAMDMPGQYPPAQVYGLGGMKVWVDDGVTGMPLAPTRGGCPLAGATGLGAGYWMRGSDCTAWGRSWPCWAAWDGVALLRDQRPPDAMGDLAAAAAAALGVLGVVAERTLNAWDLTRRGVPACLKTLRSTLMTAPRKRVLFCKWQSRQHQLEQRWVLDVQNSP